MREQRWESQDSLSFPDILNTLQRLSDNGLRTVDPDKEGITYIEEWQVGSPEGIEQLDPWPIEDLTMVHVLDGWHGDFFGDYR